MGQHRSSARAAGRARRPGVTACVLVVGLLVPAVGSPALAKPGSIAFFYGAQLRPAELALHDRVVLEPAHASADDLLLLARSGVTVFAYLSLGETQPAHPAAAKLASSSILAENPIWGSKVVDPCAPEWRALVLADAERLWKRGFRGFFLDTLDSYRLVSAPAEREQARTEAMASLVRELHERLPQARLILNRGFELLPTVGRLAQAVAAESLFRGLRGDDYVEVPDGDREWLRARLEEARSRYGLEAIVIDYVAPAERGLARRTARRILDAGFTPFVTDRLLGTAGVGLVEPLRRRILLVHPRGEVPGSVVDAVEALGYEVVQAAPRELRRHAGVPLAGSALWLDPAEPPAGEDLDAFLDAQLDAGAPLALIGDPNPWAAPELLARLDPSRLSAAAGAERTYARADLRPVVTPRGGLCFAPAMKGRHGCEAASVDFVCAALQLQPLPHPVVERENGASVVVVPSSRRDAAGAARLMALRRKLGRRDRLLALSEDELAARRAAALDFAIGRHLDGRWAFASPKGALRTVRLHGRLGWPDLASSPAVAGAAIAEDGASVVAFLAPLHRGSIDMTPSPPSGVRLEWANAPLLQWRRHEDRVTLRLRGHTGIELVLAGASDCRWDSGEPLIVDAAGRTRIAMKAHDTGVLRLVCAPAGDVAPANAAGPAASGSNPGTDAPDAGTVPRPPTPGGAR